jgi:two-component system phosphate regulon response regulator PhoB
VFLDVMLPGMSGIEVLRRMRANPALGDVAVVVVSAWQGPQDIAAALESGADGFLEKPFRVDELASVARGLVGRRR